MNKTVTEADFRKPEFVNADIRDYEKREDGAIVRKDRWEQGLRKVAYLLEINTREWEIEEVIVAVVKLTEPKFAPFLVGNTYRTLKGDYVKVVEQRSDTILGKDGKWRYNSPNDAGRVTGSEHDYSCPDNFVRFVAHDEIIEPT